MPNVLYKFYFHVRFYAPTFHNISDVLKCARRRMTFVPTEPEQFMPNQSLFCIFKPAPPLRQKSLCDSAFIVKRTERTEKK